MQVSKSGPISPILRVAFCFKTLKKSSLSVLEKGGSKPIEALQEIAKAYSSLFEVQISAFILLSGKWQWASNM